MVRVSLGLCALLLGCAQTIPNGAGKCAAKAALKPSLGLGGETLPEAMPGGLLEFVEAGANGPERKICTFLLELNAEAPDTALAWTSTHCLKPNRIESMKLALSTEQGFVELPLARMDFISDALALRASLGAKAEEPTGVKALSFFESPELAGPANPLSRTGKHICAMLLGIGDGETDVVASEDPLSKFLVPDASVRKACATNRDLSSFRVHFRSDRGAGWEALLAQYAARQEVYQASRQSQFNEQSQTILQHVRRDVEMRTWTQWLASLAIAFYSDLDGGVGQSYGDTKVGFVSFSERPTGLFSLLSSCGEGTECSSARAVFAAVEPHLPTPAAVRERLDTWMTERDCATYKQANTEEMFWSLGLILNLSKLPPEDVGDACRKAQAIVDLIDSEAAATGHERWRFLEKLPSFSTAVASNHELATIFLLKGIRSRAPYWNDYLAFHTNYAPPEATSATEIRFSSLVASRYWNDYPLAPSGSAQRTVTSNAGILFVGDTASDRVRFSPGDSGTVFTFAGVPMFALNSVDGEPYSGGLAMRPTGSVQEGEEEDGSIIQAPVTENGTSPGGGTVTTSTVPGVKEPGC